MVRLQEVYETISSADWRNRHTYKLRDIFVNPEHIQFIRPNQSNKLQESLGNKGQGYCNIWIQGREVVVVGTLEQLEEKLFKNKRILHD